MTILIKGMDMPDSCKDCTFVNRKWHGDICPILKREVTGNVERGGFQADCSLVPVPPHGDLIDREELLNDVSGVYTARPEEALKIQREINKVLFAIQDAPTVIEAEDE